MTQASTAGHARPAPAADHPGLEQRREREATLRAEVVAQTRALQVDVVRVAEGVRQPLVAIAEMPTIRAGDAAGCTAYLHAVAGQYPAYSLLAVNDAQGLILCSSAGTAPGDYSNAARAYFQRAMASGGFAAGDLMMGKATGRPGIHFALPFRRTDSEVGGVVLASVDQSWLSGLLDAGAPPPGAEALVLDPSGTVADVFGLTRGEGVIRSDDLAADPRCGPREWRRGMPEGYMPVRSYLAAPVVSRGGEVLGSLVFGHSEPGAFTEAAERVVAGLAGQAASTIDNARLFRAAQRANETLEARMEERTRDLRLAIATLHEEVLERKRTEDALRQSQRMEAVGQLTGGIAHDFNNMLQGIGGALETVQRRVAQGRVADLAPLMEAARQGLTRAAALTQRLLAFARRQTLDPRPVEPDALIEGMEELIRRTAGPGIAVEMRLNDGVWTVLRDPNQLENALLNLAINAQDAMPDGGRLTLATEDVCLSMADIAGHEEGDAGARL